MKVSEYKMAVADLRSDLTEAIAAYFRSHNIPFSMSEFLCSTTTNLQDVAVEAMIYGAGLSPNYDVTAIAA